MHIMKNPETPLADRMRPQLIEEVLGQDHLIGPDTVLTRALKSGNIFPVIFWGPPGSGKTTLARLMSQYTEYRFQTFSAVISGIKELRQIVAEAEKIFQLDKHPTILFVDEIHRFNKAQQDAFLPHVESGLITLIGATTQNPSFEVIPPLLSRTRVMTLKPLDNKHILQIIQKALKDKKKGLGSYNIKATEDAVQFIADISFGDARTALNNLEIAANYILGESGASSPPDRNLSLKPELKLDLKAVEKALTKKALPYDKDGEEHYNLISAFHKSMRGSDEQASLYWLYRMLMAGEDPLFIARRMIRFASEDIGLADPQALTVALAAFDSWQKIGPPEAELALAEAAAYLATAPKSNALYIAEKTVKAEIENTGNQPVPLHIRNAPTRLMKKLGYSKGYLYPHNYKEGWIKQDYLPEGVKTGIYYRPTDRGFEKEIRKRLSLIKRKKG